MNKSMIKTLNARALQTAEPATQLPQDEVKVTGEQLSEPVYWTGKQWAVTSHGIEARDGKYAIASSRVWEETLGHGWIEHMEEKSWVDLHDFTEALRTARGRWPKAPTA